MHFIKKNVSLHEYKIHKYIYDLGIVKCPKIINYDKRTKKLVMEKINNMCIADYYGENVEDIPDSVFEKIRNIIRTLYNHDIVYEDITGYNFIEFNGDVWIIDFEHTNIKKEIVNNFVDIFINSDIKSWNNNYS